MGKTYRKDQRFRPKKHGQIFVKDKSWKKNKNVKRFEIDVENRIPAVEPPDQNI